MSDNYRVTLELPLGFSEVELKANYRRLARKYHPDMVATSGLNIQEATEKFKDINEAYEKLKEEIEKCNSDPQHQQLKMQWEGCIKLIEDSLTLSGVTFDECGIVSDWKDKIRTLRSREEIHNACVPILNAISWTSIRKRVRSSVARELKEEKTNENWEKISQKGFSTKEEADEYAKKRHQTEEKSLNGDKEKDNSYTRPTSPISEISSSSSSTSSQESRPVSNPNSENNSQVLNNGKKVEVSDSKDNQLTSQNPKTDDNSPYLVLPRERQELKEQLEELKGEVASLRNQQQQQSSFQNEQLLNQQQVNNQQTKSDFPWKVVIPMGAIILILGVAVLFLLVRNKRKLK